jgi:hypothetical protein
MSDRVVEIVMCGLGFVLVGSIVLLLASLFVRAAGWVLGV